MKITVRLIAHISIVLNIFLLVWQAVTWLNIHENGIWFGFGASLLASIGKEVYDKFKKNPTGFDAVIIWKEMAIPFGWIIIYYLAYK